MAKAERRTILCNNCYTPLTKEELKDYTIQWQYSGDMYCMKCREKLELGEHDERKTSFDRPKELRQTTTQEKKRWKQEDDETWRSLEDTDITVCCNAEDDEDNDETMYLVYPAHKDIGIPNSPAQFDASAHVDALDEASKIRKLPIHQIRKFKWSMIK